MPRRSRLSLSGFPLHVVQRGNNRAECFRSDADRRLYLDWLGESAERNNVLIHAWVLMTNHVHLLVSCEFAQGISRMMQTLGRVYVRRFNDVHGRTGTLWEGRFKACAIHGDEYLLACMRYIELNPVRAGLAEDPAQHPWSSYRRNAWGSFDRLVAFHPVYLGLGETEAQCQSAYRRMFGEHSPVDDNRIRKATACGHLLGPEGYARRMELERGVRLGPGLRGRPRNVL